MRRQVNHDPYISLMDTYRAVKVLSEGHRRSDNSAQIEDGPEDADKHALLVLGRIGEHQGALRSPEETGADAKVSASCEDERANAMVYVVCAAETSISDGRAVERRGEDLQVGANVKRIAGCAKEERQSRA